MCSRNRAIELQLHLHLMAVKWFPSNFSASDSNQLISDALLKIVLITNIPILQQFTLQFLVLFVFQNIYLTLASHATGLSRGLSICIIILCSLGVVLFIRRNVIMISCFVVLFYVSNCDVYCSPDVVKSLRIVMLCSTCVSPVFRDYVGYTFTLYVECFNII